MAVDKLVDSTQLDSDLTSVANAIRTRGGTSADLAFPAGFVSAVQAIPTGGGGLDYDLKEVTVSGNTSTVDRAFDDFILIAQCQKSSIPAAADRARLKAYFLMFAYVDGKYIPTGGSNGFDVSTQTAGSATMSGGATGMSSASIGATSITFSTYSTHSMQKGKWDVLQIELPSDSPIYAFADL